jgi:hypothetical protein
LTASAVGHTYTNLTAMRNNPDLAEATTTNTHTHQHGYSIHTHTLTRSAWAKCACRRCLLEDEPPPAVPMPPADPVIRAAAWSGTPCGQGNHTALARQQFGLCASTARVPAPLGGGMAPWCAPCLAFGVPESSAALGTPGFEGGQPDGSLQLHRETPHTMHTHAHIHTLDHKTSTTLPNAKGPHCGANIQGCKHTQVRRGWRPCPVLTSPAPAHQAMLQPTTCHPNPHTESASGSSLSSNHTERHSARTRQMTKGLTMPPSGIAAGWQQEPPT